MKISTLTDTIEKAAHIAVIKKAKPQLSAIYIQWEWFNKYFFKNNDNILYVSYW